MATEKPSLGSTGLEAWRAWRALPWQNLPCYGNALGVGEFCWQPNRSTPSGMELHRVVNDLCTRPATQAEQDDVWDCLLTGALRIYTRTNRLGASKAPVRILHEMTGNPLISGVME